MTPFRQLKRAAARAVLTNGGAAAFARLYKCRFEVVEGSLPQKDARATLAAVNPCRFRGELEALASAGFRVLRAPYDLQTRMLGLFFDRDDEVLCASSIPELRAKQSGLRMALRPLIKTLYEHHNIDATIGAALHYKQDSDWGTISSELGYPYVVLHRENLAGSVSTREHYANRGERIDPFRGDMLLFHNNVMRNIFVNSGYVDEAKAASPGAIRMDSFLNALSSGSSKQARRQVTLFSFGPGAGVMSAMPPQWPTDGESYFKDLCHMTHCAVLEFAIENPDVDVIIKPKWGGTWIENVLQMFEERGLGVGQAPNLQILPDANAQDLIFESAVVIGFASTTLLEAAIAGRAVIVPLFAEATRPELQNEIFFSEHLDIFDGARDPESLKSLIRGNLNSPAVDRKRMEHRRKVFEEYVSPLDGSAVEKTAELICETIKTRRYLGRRITGQLLEHVV